MSLEALNNLPEVNFVPTDVESMLSEAIAGYEKAYYEATGESITLAKADPRRIFIYSQVLREYQLYQLIDFAAKQNLLKYAADGYLDNFGARYGEKGKRQGAKAALTTVRYTLSAPQLSIVPIPKGNRTSPGNDIFFETIDYAEIPVGQLSIDIPVQCTVAGEMGNGFVVGQINTLVDPIPFIKTVSNIDTSQGGTDIQNDDSLKEKIFLAPESFSVAGPEGAYEFFAKEYLSTILDVKITSPSPGVVDLRLILKDGEIPTETTIQGLQDYLSDKKRRPLTDKVQVGAPTQVPYNIDLIYYIKKSDESIATTIQIKVNQAIQEYMLWQKTKIGRDIDPDELNARIRAAGAKRAVIIAPIFTNLEETEQAIEGAINIVYGGVEND